MKKLTWLLVAFLISHQQSFSQDLVKVTGGAIFSTLNGATLYVAGGIILDNTSNLTNDGTIIIDRTIAGAADFTDNNVASHAYGSGTFTFKGIGMQSITGVNRFGHINVNNTGLNLGSDIDADNWHLQAGRVSTGNFLAIVHSSAPSALDADALNPGFSLSWIDGKLRRYIAPSTVNGYVFPVGNAARVYAAGLNGLSSDPITGVSYITASFGPKPGTDVGLNAVESGTTFAAINTAGVWHLVPDVNPASGKFDLDLSLPGFADLTDNSFAILRRPDLSSNASEWSGPLASQLPVAGAPGRMAGDGFARRNRIGTFGQFGIGTALRALPLELVSFTGTRKEKTVLLEWTTVNEQNTDHFELLRGNAPGSMQQIHTTAAAGFTSDTRNYAYTDPVPLPGMNYYQLRMIDRDGRFTMSGFVKVKFDEVQSITIYPNPVTGKDIFVQYTGDHITQVKLITLDGKQVSCSMATTSPGSLRVAMSGQVASGTYALQLIANSITTTRLVVIR